MLHVKNRKAFIYSMMNVYRGTWVTCLALTYRPCT